VGVVPILVVISITVAGGFLLAFLWATRNGQYDDLDTPSIRMLREDVKREDVKREDVKREDVKREDVKREDVKKQKPCDTVQTLREEFENKSSETLK